MIKSRQVLKNIKILSGAFAIALCFVLYINLYTLSNNQISHETTQETTTADDKTAEKTCSFKDTLSYLKYSDSAWDRNNKFGLYIYAENKDFMEIAQTIVNSNEGDYGYVLIPYNVRDTDVEKWADVFFRLNNKHLIPIIQLWDINVDDFESETKDAAIFLDQFLWPIKERYISVYNEPNDDAFWYGKRNPEQYAKILDYTIDTFKSQNQDFYMLNGAFNVSAGNTSSSTDSFTFMKEMNDKVPGIFNKLDGFASHSYPQPNFSGTPKAKGRWSIYAYDEELKFLKTLNVAKDLPVFITETGWAHAEGKSYNSSFLSADRVAEYFKEAFEKTWLPDKRVRAVIAFTVKYDAPFDHFSWVNDDGVLYKQASVVQSLKKLKGNPPALFENITNLCLEK